MSTGLFLKAKWDMAAETARATAASKALSPRALNFSKESSTQKLLMITAGIMSHTSRFARDLLPSFVIFPPLNRANPTSIYIAMVRVC